MRRDAVFLLLVLQIFGMGDLGDLKDLAGDHNIAGFGSPVHQPGAVIVVVLRRVHGRLEVDLLRKRRGRITAVDHPVEFAPPGFG